MKKSIEKHIHAEVQSYLDELDIEGMIEDHTTEKYVRQEVKRMVHEKIANIVNDAFVKAFIKQGRFIDSWANEKLKGLLQELGINGMDIYNDQKE